MASSRAVLGSGDIWGLAQTSAGAYGVILWIIGIWCTSFWYFFYELDLSVLLERKWKKDVSNLLSLEPTWRSEVYSGVQTYENTLKLWAVLYFFNFKMNKILRFTHNENLLKIMIYSRWVCLFIRTDLDRLEQNLSLHHLLTNGSSTVNGCRQNESPNSW